MTESAHCILIVDDEKQVVEGLRRTLRHEGYRLITETDPLAAVEVLRSGGVDILISDIDMPQMSGLELIAEARKHHPEVMRILLTGDASLDSALEAINHGQVHKYLTKPWSARGLRDSLREMVARIEALRAEAATAARIGAERERVAALEERFPGIANVARVEGAYLLNDMRTLEALAAIDGTETFAASRWKTLSADVTQDIRRG